MTDDPEDVWTRVAQAAKDLQEEDPVIYEDRTNHSNRGGGRALRCPDARCMQLIALSESGQVKVHFALATDAKPCVGSFKTICPTCGGLVGRDDDGKPKHVDATSRTPDCSTK